MYNSQLISKIKELKAKYESIYLVDITKLKLDNKLTLDSVIVRPLTRSEFNYFNSIKDSDTDAVAEQIISLCILYPDNFITDTEFSSHILPGTDTALFKAIISISGFSSEKSLADAVKEYRNYATTLEAAITMTICKAFPRYIPSDIDNMTFDQQMKLVSMAEQILGTELPYENWLNKNSETKPKKKTKQDRIKLARERIAEQLPSPPPGWQSVTSNTNVVTKENLLQSQKELNSFLS